MDFCMRLASEVIINEIKENPNKNFVMSPLSSNCLTEEGSELSWAENETKGLVKDLIPPGQWCRPFDTSRTRHEDFHLLDGTTVKVPFMKSIRESYFYASFEGFKILKLPYEICQDNKQFPMHIFLPEKHDGLQELVQNFNSDQSMFLKRISKLSKMSVPKFKFSYGFEASKSMEKLGLKLPFKLVGDFTEMEGTEAAAASCALIMVGGVGDFRPGMY
uniref:Serpin domain-containing protein n=1 Tax=Populus trichocarpa TaxID=3694 RepID=B9N5T9_POPTR